MFWKIFLVRSCYNSKFKKILTWRSFRFLKSPSLISVILLFCRSSSVVSGGSSVGTSSRSSMRIKAISVRKMGHITSESQRMCSQGNYCCSDSFTSIMFFFSRYYIYYTLKYLLYLFQPSLIFSVTRTHYFY